MLFRSLGRRPVESGQSHVCTAHLVVSLHGARSKRQFVGTFLGIGYGNSKEFLRRLNSYGIKREKFYEALQEWEHKYG